MLTGGASAVYGSDAVAGVVNFIMNDHFEGVQVQWNGNGYQPPATGPLRQPRGARGDQSGAIPVPGDFGIDGETQNYNMLMGGNFANGKGNATLFFSTAATGGDAGNARLQRMRSVVERGRRRFLCGGSGTNATGYFYDTATGNSLHDRQCRRRRAAVHHGTDQFNFGPHNYFQRPQED